MFKFTEEEITKMENMINNFINDDRRPFLSGTETEVRELKLSNSRNSELNYVMKFSIEQEDEDEDEEEYKVGMGLYEED